MPPILISACSVFVLVSRQVSRPYLSRRFSRRIENGSPLRPSACNLAEGVTKTCSLSRIFSLSSLIESFAVVPAQVVVRQFCNESYNDGPAMQCKPCVVSHKRGLFLRDDKTIRHSSHSTTHSKQYRLDRRTPSPQTLGNWLDHCF
jgi:hypothetical protein